MIPGSTMDAIATYAAARGLNPSHCIAILSELNSLLKQDGRFEIGLHHEVVVMRRLLRRLRPDGVDHGYFAVTLSELNERSLRVNGLVDYIRQSISGLAGVQSDIGEETHWLSFEEVTELEDTRSVEQAAAELDQDLERIRELVS